MFREINQIEFPKFSGININMMPFIFGDTESIPNSMASYWDIINECNFEKDAVCYLTITETMVRKSETQRRGGIHVESPLGLGWA